MSPKLVLAAALALAAPIAAHAADAPPPAATPAAAPNTAASKAQTPPRKASAQERVMADRLEPLARAAFWSREVNIDPADTVAGVHLAAALRALGQNPAAVEAASHVLAVDPNNIEALLETARDQIAAGQGFYAIEPARHAHTLAAKDWRPLSLLGVAYVQVQREDDAQEAWRQALILSPDNPAVLSNIAMTLFAHGEATQAEPLLRRAVAQPTADLRIRQNLSLVLGAEGKLAEKSLREDLPPDQATADLAYLQDLAAGRGGAPAAAAPAQPATTRSWNTVRDAGG
jgi:Flp pilus assembly protein TadD